MYYLYAENTKGVVKYIYCIVTAFLKRYVMIILQLAYAIPYSSVAS